MTCLLSMQISNQTQQKIEWTENLSVKIYSVYSKEKIISHNVAQESKLSPFLHTFQTVEAQLSESDLIYFLNSSPGGAKPVTIRVCANSIGRIIELDDVPLHYN